jgi:tRNA G10  N-methylase Trm11
MTPRTLDIIDRIANGYSNEQISQELEIPIEELTELIRQKEVQVAISEMSKEVMAGFGNSKEQIKTMMRRVIISDLTDFYNQDGTMRPFNEIPKVLRMCITELEFKHGTDAMGMPTVNTRIKTISKDKAVEILARLDHLFSEKPEKEGVEINIGYE